VYFIVVEKAHAVVQSASAKNALVNLSSEASIFAGVRHEGSRLSDTSSLQPQGFYILVVQLLARIRKFTNEIP